jgi:hypothetical protein
MATVKTFSSGKIDNREPIIAIFEKLLTIINSGAGRDKSCRIIQYALMAAVPIFQAKGAHFKVLVDRLSKLKGSMSMTRKVLRFGKEIPLITGIRQKLIKHEQSPMRMILYRILADLSLILYFFTDHPLYFHNLGFWKFSPRFMANCDWFNQIFWLLGALFDIVVTCAEISHLQKQIRTIQKKLEQGGGKMAGGASSISAGV